MFNSLSLLFPERIITVWPSDPDAPGSLEDEVHPLGECGTMYVLVPRSHHSPTPFNDHTNFLIDSNFDM